jgi:ADP-ribosylglycohydrolase
VFFFGDNDSVSAISGSWFGALKGIDNFPEKKFKELEFYSKLEKLIKDFSK